MVGSNRLMGKALMIQEIIYRSQNIVAKTRRVFFKQSVTLRHIPVQEVRAHEENRYFSSRGGSDLAHVPLEKPGARRNYL
jgi:hypothetical protein